MQTDDANMAIQGNVAIASESTRWPTLEQMQVAPAPGDQILS